MHEWIIGGLYSVPSRQGGFKVIKILVIDEFAVHVRLYKQPFNVRPLGVDPGSLTVGTIHDKDGFGMGHLPLSEREFASWGPAFILQAAVVPEELEGYRFWKEHNGGIWDVHL